MSDLEIVVIAGGEPGSAGHAAIATAVRRTLGARSDEHEMKTSAWARAGRFEAISDVHIRSKAQLEELPDR